MKKRLAALVILVLVTAVQGLAADGTFDNLTANGNVGIGTVATPQYKLDVRSTGTGLMSNFGSTANTQYSDLLITTDTGNAQIWKQGSGLTQYGGAGSLNIYNSQHAPITFYLGEAEQMRLDNEGKLGIGTKTPSAKLHVQAYADNQWASYINSTGATGAAGLLVQMGASSTGAPFAIYKGTAAQLYVDNSGNVGIGTDSTTGNKLTISGNTYTNGYIQALSGACTSSDIRFKQNIAPIGNALSKVEHLQGVTFNWKTEEFKEKNFDTTRQIGFIAQDVEAVLPEVVRTDAEGYKSLSYEKLTAVLVEALKEQQKEIKALKAEMEQLKAR